MNTAKIIAKSIGTLVGIAIRTAIQASVATVVFISICQTMGFYFA